MSEHEVQFRGALVRFAGKGGWTMVPVPESLAPPVTTGWGRTPVHAMVDGVGWEGSVWRDSERGSFLPVPAKVRRGKGHGDEVDVQIRLRPP